MFDRAALIGNCISALNIRQLLIAAITPMMNDICGTASGHFTEIFTTSDSLHCRLPFAIFKKIITFAVYYGSKKILKFL